MPNALLAAQSRSEYGGTEEIVQASRALIAQARHCVSDDARIS